MTTNLIETMADAMRELRFGSHVGDSNMHRARAAFSAIEAAGYRVVPVNATMDMAAAALATDGEVGRIYAAMLAAAPKVSD
jgi:hypothetical protein